MDGYILLQIFFSCKTLRKAKSTDFENYFNLLPQRLKSAHIALINYFPRYEDEAL